MRSGRARVRPLLVVAMGVGAALVGCLSVDWPQTVESGNVSGAIAGGTGTSTTQDSGTTDDAGGDSGDEGEAITALESCTSSTAAVCAYYEAVSSTGTTTCAGTIGTTCPTASLVGCCTASSNGNTVETCYYAGSATTLSNTCTSGSPAGTWSTVFTM